MRGSSGGGSRELGLRAMRISRVQSENFGCVEVVPSAPSPTPITAGFRLTPEKLARITQLRFYDRLDQFIRTLCLKQGLLDWLARNDAARPIWDPVWPSVRSLSEHDCALALVLLAVCACEGVSLPPADRLIAQLPHQEVDIKRFLIERGYFHFSDFEFVGVSVLRTPAAA